MPLSRCRKLSADALAGEQRPRVPRTSATGVAVLGPLAAVELEIDPHRVAAAAVVDDGQQFDAGHDQRLRARRTGPRPCGLAARRHSVVMSPVPMSSASARSIGFEDLGMATIRQLTARAPPGSWRAALSYSASFLRMPSTTCCRRAAQEGLVSELSLASWRCSSRAARFSLTSFCRCASGIFGTRSADVDAGSRA